GPCHHQLHIKSPHLPGTSSQSLHRWTYLLLSLSVNFVRPLPECFLFYWSILPPALCRYRNIQPADGHPDNRSSSKLPDPVSTSLLSRTAALQSCCRLSVHAALQSSVSFPACCSVPWPHSQ